MDYVSNYSVPLFAVSNSLNEVPDNLKFTLILVTLNTEVI